VDLSARYAKQSGLAGAVRANNNPTLIRLNLPVDIVENWALIAHHSDIV
jgi:hypothetical protein